MLLAFLPSSSFSTSFCPSVRRLSSTNLLKKPAAKTFLGDRFRYVFFHLTLYAQFWFFEEKKDIGKALFLCCFCCKALTQLHCISLKLKSNISEAVVSADCQLRPHLTALGTFISVKCEAVPGQLERLKVFYIMFLIGLL